MPLFRFGARILTCLVLLALGWPTAPALACEGSGPACARVASPVLSPDGTVLVAWPDGERLLVARSSDGGKTLEPASVIQAPHALFDMPEGRPVLAADGRGRVFAAFVIKQPDAKYAGTLMLAVSQDGGRSFAPARAIASDPSSQGFVGMVVEDGGRLTLAWIDKRGAATARRNGVAYRGAGLVLAWSDDGGATFSHQDMAADHACECCRVAMALDHRGLPLVMWRHIFEPNRRDHALLSFEAKGRPAALQPVGRDGWHVDACPHHGPALASVSDGSVHAVWFTKGDIGPGLYHAQGRPGAGFGRQMAFGDPSRRPSHPQVAAHGDRVRLVWKEFDGSVTRIMTQESSDAGRNWGRAHSVAETTDASDHPVLLDDGSVIRLSWLTRKEGWRVLVLEGAP